MKTREEFDKFRLGEAFMMHQDLDLEKKSLDLLSRADKYHWIHQTNFMGQPALQLPQDMFAMAEIIWKIKPEIIVELGSCWCGTTLFLTSVLNTCNPDGHVFGIDIYQPEDLKRRIYNTCLNNSLHHCHLITSSSIDTNLINVIENLSLNTLGKTRILVIMDSDHTESHLLKELDMWFPLVPPESYIVVCDTVIEKLPEEQERIREWGPENNPATALDKFMKLHGDFEIDTELQNKLLLSCNTYVRRN